MISAEKFARAGDKYIGRTYSEMDCQKFYEHCTKDTGLSLDLAGSNAWYRKFIQTGWTGTPEECKKKFGRIPAGATLFIHAFDGGEEKRGYHDGLGNASHIGIVTRRTGAEMVQETGRTDMDFGDGAVHSSSSRGHVCTSKFKDATVKNGGWNMVGLSSLFDYGEDINGKLPGGGGADQTTEPAQEQEQEPTSAEVWAVVDGPNGERVITRKGPGKNYDMSKAGKLKSGERVQVIETKRDWSKIVCNPKGTVWVCWILSEYLTQEDTDRGEPFPEETDPEEDEPAEDQAEPWDDGGEASEDCVTIRLTTDDAARLFSLLDMINDQIIDQLGRG